MQDDDFNFITDDLPNTNQISEPIGSLFEEPTNSPPLMDISVFDKPYPVCSHSNVFMSSVLSTVHFDHPCSSEFIRRNLLMRSYYPDEYQKFSTIGNGYNYVLPVKNNHFREKIIEYSHDIVWMILNKKTLSEVDSYITKLVFEPATFEDRPPFRFEFLNVLVPDIAFTYSSYLS